MIIICYSNNTNTTNKCLSLSLSLALSIYLSISLYTYLYIYIYIYTWLRTNRVITNGAAAKVMTFDRLGNKLRPGTFGNVKVGSREYPKRYPKRSLSKNMNIAVTPLVLTPFFPFRDVGRPSPTFTLLPPGSRRVNNIWPRAESGMKDSSTGWHYSSNATCLIQPHMFYALFIVQRITMVCLTYSSLLKNTSVRQVVLDTWFPLIVVMGRRAPLCTQFAAPGALRHDMLLPPRLTTTFRIET